MASHPADRHESAAIGENTIRLAPGARYVPASLLASPAEIERRRLARDGAAFLLNRHLRRLSRMRNPLELRLGRLLRRLKTSSGYLELGFAHLADYVTERLGISVRRMQALLQIDSRLDDLPLLGDAYRRGLISHSQLRLLLRVATPATEEHWVQRARTLSVRLLDKEVRAAGRAGSSDAACDGAGESARGLSVGTGPAAGTAADVAPAAGLIDEDEQGHWESFRSPEDVRERWDLALELCRASAGASVPDWQCAEFIAVDFLAGVPDLPALLGAGAGAGGTAEPVAMDSLQVDEACPAERGDRDPADGVDLFREVLARYEEEYGARGWMPSADGAEVVLPDAVREDRADGPRDLDERLRLLVRLRQDLACHQGRLLRTFASLGLHRELGFLSFGGYCVERAGLGLRRARQLIALDRRLDLLPHVAKAYRGGELSWVQASAIARVADAESEGAWLLLATSVTVRRLRDEVALVAAGFGDELGLGDEAGIEAAAGAGGQARRRSRRPLGLDPAGRVEPICPRRRAAARVQTCAPEGGGRAAEADAAGRVLADQAVQTCASWTTVRFWAPVDVARLWRHAIDVCSLVAGKHLEDWECVIEVLDSFCRTWQVRGDPEWQRRYRVYERDGWRCRVPGCSSRRNLQPHHIVYKSQDGGDEDDNLVTLCATHHHQGIHSSRVRCRRLPDGLLAWELGRRADGQPLARFIEDVVCAAADSRLRIAAER